VGIADRQEALWRQRAAPPGRALAAGCRSGSGARMCALASGRRRPEEQYFCRTGLHASPPSTVTISCYLQATTNESNHKDHEAHKGRTKTFCQGHLTHYPILKVHDNLLIVASQLVGRLGPWLEWAALSGRASHRGAARARGPDCARSCPVGGRQVGGMWSKNRRRKDLASEVPGL